MMRTCVTTSGFVVGDLQDTFVDSIIQTFVVFVVGLNSAPSRTSDRFPGRVDVTRLTSQSAVLTWLPFPGTIDRYQVEVEVGGELKVNQMVTNATSLDLADLTPGSLHAVRVFPVKGQREKHPQQTAFYTRPNKVENLAAVQVTETSVALNWSKPDGNVELYSVESEGVETGRSQTEGTVVVNLTPGTLHTFAVLSAVNGSSTRSDESSVAAYTRPGKVSGLQVSGNTHCSVVLKWVKPKGHTTGYRVKATTASGDPPCLLFSGNVTQTEVKVTSLPPGTRIKLTVTALTNHDALEGDNVTIDSYTSNSGLLV
ncbi:receptor-type tyrosine-protein phosphatase eta-like [Pungitius pungitius]|uniref:receptor-type tyrosine-protein phosphatase eta-like n=1 Tax=Pungitius pungitius TaxID=134920 RepID=UPI002E117FBE